MFKTIFRIVQIALPVIVMIALIPFIRNDMILALVDIFIIGFAFSMHYDKKDLLFLVFGFIALTLSESFFVSTGVEIFQRQSLLGIMPLWLPILWAYAFVAMRRAIMVLDLN